MRPLKPPIAYVASFLLAAIPQAAKKMLESQDWWGALPFGWISLLGIAFCLGLVVQDLYNSRSWLRSVWREYRKVFEALACHISQESTPHEYFGIFLLVKFAKDVKDADLIISSILLLPHGNRTTTVYSEKVIAHKHQEKRLLLASIPITRPGDAFARHGLLGPELGGQDLMPGQHSFIGGKSVIEVSVKGQKYRVCIGELAQTMGEPVPLFIVSENDMQLYDAA